MPDLGNYESLALKYGKVYIFEMQKINCDGANS
jgi:hypothetical protein